MILHTSSQALDICRQFIAASATASCISPFRTTFFGSRTTRTFLDLVPSSRCRTLVPPAVFHWYHSLSLLYHSFFSRSRTVLPCRTLVQLSLIQPAHHSGEPPPGSHHSGEPPPGSYHLLARTTPSLQCSAASDPPVDSACALTKDHAYI
jgi:hypothetical protein